MKIAKSDGHATIRIVPESGKNAVEVRRKVVAGDRVPDWLANDVDEKLDVKEEADPKALAAGYSINGGIEPVRDRDETTTPPGVEDDELAGAKPAGTRAVKAAKKTD